MHLQLVSHPEPTASPRPSLSEYLRRSDPVNVLALHAIYSLAIPLIVLDIWVTLYQWMCFPLFGMARVPRRPYFVFDRHRLEYLTAIERVHCHYCSYATGVLGYVREIAARTEKFWCPIKHGRAVPDAHGHYREFFDYGDASGYRDGLARLRSTLQPDNQRPACTGEPGLK